MGMEITMKRRGGYVIIRDEDTSEQIAIEAASYRVFVKALESIQDQARALSAFTAETIGELCTYDDSTNDLIKSVVNNLAWSTAVQLDDMGETEREYEEKAISDGHGYNVSAHYYWRLVNEWAEHLLKLRAYRKGYWRGKPPAKKGASQRGKAGRPSSRKSAPKGARKARKAGR